MCDVLDRVRVRVIATCTPIAGHVEVTRVSAAAHSHECIPPRLTPVAPTRLVSTNCSKKVPVRSREDGV